MYIISSESQNLTHGGGWEGQNLAKSISEESTQSYPRKGHEKDKVQKTDSKGLQTGYLRHPHAPKERIDKSLVEDWQIIKRRLKK
jgi:hypothetical protein